MRIETRGYQITGIPGDGVINIQPDPTQGGGVRVDVILAQWEIPVSYDRAGLENLRIAIEHATRLAGQIEDEAS